MSAIPPIADIAGGQLDVRFVPKAEMTTANRKQSEIWTIFSTCVQLPRRVVYRWSVGGNSLKRLEKHCAAAASAPHSDWYKLCHCSWTTTWCCCHAQIRFSLVAFF